MSVAHFHLLLNHFPIVGIILVTLLLGVAYVRKSDELARVSLWGLAGLAVVSLIVFLTGEPAEDSIEHLPGFSQAITERHEEAALVATIALGMVGAVALSLLVWIRKHGVTRKIIGTVFILSLIGSGIMGYAAMLGGQVRHTEIRSASVAASSQAEGDD
jgi:uncharacterized membrane protein